MEIATYIMFVLSINQHATTVETSERVKRENVFIFINNERFYVTCFQKKRRHLSLRANASHKNKFYRWSMFCLLGVFTWGEWVNSGYLTANDCRSGTTIAYLIIAEDVLHTTMFSFRYAHFLTLMNILHRLIRGILQGVVKIPQYQLSHFIIFRYNALNIG